MVKEDREDSNKAISEAWVRSNNICDLWRFSKEFKIAGAIEYFIEE
jgi:hypothetical protein